MARAKKKNITTESDIISAYMDYTLEYDVSKNNAHVFCKTTDIEESDFYEHFGSIEALEKKIWHILLTTSIDTASNDESFSEFTDQEKLLSVLYTFFENLTLNRSYVLENLKTNTSIGKRKTLFSQMKKVFSQFIDDIFHDNRMAMSRSNIKTLDSVRKQAFREGFWAKFIFLINFWKKDESKSFESTDIIIEKSVRAAMDLLDATPRNSFIDLGKFLWKEKVQN